ncbi:MAG: hypothetical protein JWM63_3189 [Gammaproteobacteria bacterium]|nr:hypothetical protein [Gammaproteobacteria bacterium]
MVTIVFMVATVIVIVIAMVVAVMIVMLTFGILTVLPLTFGILTLLPLTFCVLTLLALTFCVLTLLTLVHSIPSRSIAGFIFCRPDKIHASIARMIFVAMRAPIPRVSRRHMQIYRLDAVSILRFLYENRLRVYHSRRRGSVG